MKKIKQYSYNAAKIKGEEMRIYELNTKINEKQACILRLDGVGMTKAFKVVDKQFNQNFMDKMERLSLELAAFLPSAILLYQYSDEISILIDPHQEKNNFNNRIEKLLSIVSGKASAIFNRLNGGEKDFCFDCRIVQLPSKEITKYFESRQAFAIIKFLEELRSRNLKGEQKFLKKSQDIINALQANNPNIDYMDFSAKVRNGTVVFYDRSSKKWIAEGAPELLTEKEYIERRISSFLGRK